jgi:hypothetical protein
MERVWWEVFEVWESVGEGSRRLLRTVWLSLVLIESCKSVDYTHEHIYGVSSFCTYHESNRVEPSRVGLHQLKVSKTSSSITVNMNHESYTDSCIVLYCILLCSALLCSSIPCLFLCKVSNSRDRIYNQDLDLRRQESHAYCSCLLAWLFVT